MKKNKKNKKRKQLKFKIQAQIYYSNGNHPGTVVYNNGVFVFYNKKNVFDSFEIYRWFVKGREAARFSVDDIYCYSTVVNRLPRSYKLGLVLNNGEYYILDFGAVLSKDIATVFNENEVDDVPWIDFATMVSGNK